MQGHWPRIKEEAPDTDGGWKIAERSLDGPGSLLALRGDFDVSCVRELRRALETVVAERSGPLILDLSDVTFIDSLSIAAMVAARRRLGEDRRMAVVAQHPYVLLIFEAGGLDSVVPLFSTIERAEAHVWGG
jgi:anti-sigma B factor antagonist